MTKIFQNSEPFPEEISRAEAVLARLNPPVSSLAAGCTEQTTCDKLSHAETSSRTGSLPAGSGSGEQLTLPADWAVEPPVLRNAIPERYAIGQDGQVSLSPPYLLIRYADGRVTVRTYADGKVMTRAHVQAVKPTGQLPAGTTVTAVYMGGARVEKTKRAG